MYRCEKWRTVTGGAFAAALLAVPVFVNAVPPAADPFFELIGTYTTGLADVGEELTSGEVAALKGDKLFVSNASDTSVDIVDVSDPTMPELLKRLDLSAFGTEVTSVAVGNGRVAATVEAGTAPGMLVVFSPGGADLRAVEVGAGPDMITFTPDGKRILVANEGEPSGYLPGDTDPPGSISVVDVQGNRLTVHTIDFAAFNPGGPRASELPAGVRIFGSSLPSLDLEPEYVTVSGDGQTAWVSLQENNAIAVLNLNTLTVTRINALGYKDHSVVGSGLDASDQDPGIVIKEWPNIFGMYQPDALAAFRIADHDYVLSANEGDARDYAGLGEEARLRATTTDMSFGPARANNQAGRLNVTTSTPGSPTGQTQVYAFGARSFSIWDGANGALVFDSGDALEQLTAAELPSHFNSDNTANNFDNRSDNKGPEPEAATVGVVNGRTYGFVGFERIGGFIVIDLSDPASPEILQYLNNRDFLPSSPIGPDSGPEVIDFVPAAQSPNGRDLVVVANEITGTVSIYAAVVP